MYDTFSLPSACLCHHRSDFAIRHSLLASQTVDLPQVGLLNNVLVHCSCNLSLQCPKAEKLSLPPNVQPEAFAHSFSSSTKQPTTSSTEKSDISFLSSRKSATSTKKPGSTPQKQEKSTSVKPETSSASSAIRFGDRRRRQDIVILIICQRRRSKSSTSSSTGEGTLQRRGG